MKARISHGKVLHFFDSGSEVADQAFVAKLYDPEGSHVVDLAMNQVTEVPSLYLSDSYTPETAGHWNVFFEYDGSVIYSERLEVGQPLSDVPLDEEVTEVLPAQTAGGDGETITAYIMNSSGETIVDDDDDDPLPCAYDADYNGYLTPFTCEDEDDYFIVWTKDGTPIAAKSVFAIKPYGLENVRFFAATLEGNNGTPHTFTTVVVSRSNGTQVEIGVTDAEGLLDLQVPVGTYVITLVKSGIAFSVNNFSITVGNSIAEDLGVRQSYHLLTGAFTPTVSSEQDKASMCTLFASIYKMDGSPLAHAPVHVRMLTKPQLYSGTTVYDSQLYFKTDSNGKVEFDLIQGLEIEVSIPPMGLRRIITVPSDDDAAEPVNLFTLLSDSKDLFDIQKPQIQTAPRRTR